MINVVVGGATGKLGRMVCQLILEDSRMDLTGAIVSSQGGNVGKELYPGVVACGPDAVRSCLADADVYVDLTTPDAASRLIPSIPDTNTNLVVGTTAVDEEAVRSLKEALKKTNNSALMSANFSLGVNLFWRLCEMMASSLPGYDIELIDIHHNQKKDSPSGTAMEAVRAMQAVTGIEAVRHGREGKAEKRGREIGVHSLRAGDVVGDHTVIFAGNMERLEVTHRAVSREAFARGCVEAINWIADKRDGELHSMREVLNL
ncbi:MAG: 4-hydroxy-tetrahydrodipicolinate reductase [Candidatus Methanomethylophilaceae archaeon]|nr:4-hydroxy-tetrahydrodipicolinate reductase [Candidatus Methanomethylophilaceae archaeon]